MTEPIDTSVNKLIINTLTQTQYKEAKQAGTIDDNQLYMITDTDIEAGTTFNLLDFKWTDHILNDQSWTRADTFSWQDGTVYSTAYNELLSEYNNTSSVKDTDKVTLPVKLPTFTANTTDGITVADARNNTDAYTLINGVTRKEIGHWSDYWFSINYGYSTIIKSYTIKADSGGSPEYPSMWELQGSNDGGESWQNLDYKVDEVFALGEEKTYVLSGDGFSAWPHRMYRILFHNGVESSSNGELGKISFNVEKVLGYVSYKRTPKGYKIANKDQESAISEMYTNMGVAWYYIIDTTNERFKLPRTQYGFVGLRDTVGKYIPESLPNIKGSAKNESKRGILDSNDPDNVSGAFKIGESTSQKLSSSSSTGYALDFDASLSSSTYQDNAPVQERATQMYLYFYVGKFSQTATEQTAGLNAELFNSKADLDLSNAVANASTTAKETIVGWGMPDWSAGIDIETPLSASPYVCPSDGVYCFCFMPTQTIGSLYVNGIKTANCMHNSTSNNANKSTTSVFLQKNDSIYFDNGATSNGLYSSTFYPLKGV